MPLMLTRRLNEGVVITMPDAREVRIVVTRVGAAPLLSFDAPADVSIYREEIYREIAAANRAAVHPDGSGDAGARLPAPDDGSADR